MAHAGQLSPSDVPRRRALDLGHERTGNQDATQLDEDDSRRMRT
jgi:hypothetical protein